VARIVATAGSVRVSAGMSLEAGELASPLGAMRAVVPSGFPTLTLKRPRTAISSLEIPDFKVQAVGVIAGPVGAADGCRRAMWQLYRPGDVLNVSQVLLHLLRSPRRGQARPAPQGLGLPPGDSSA
jgi:hypothetical protein